MSMCTTSPHRWDVSLSLYTRETSYDSVELTIISVPIPDKLHCISLYNAVKYTCGNENDTFRIISKVLLEHQAIFF